MFPRSYVLGSSVSIVIYSKGAMFLRFLVPWFLCFHGPVSTMAQVPKLPGAYVCKFPCYRGLVFPESPFPQLLCYQDLMFPNSLTPKFLYSLGHIFLGSYDSKVWCSQCPMFPSSYIPHFLCPWGPMFPTPVVTSFFYVPSVQCS